MNALSIAIAIFAVIESLNILMLYFKPGSRMGNGIGVFDAWERSEQDPVVHGLVKYLVNWVAGTKLIFVTLLIVIFFTGSETTKLFAVAALILSILTFYWRLYPAIRRMDREGIITPKGYSKTLFGMITVFLVGFITVMVVHLVL